VTSLRRRHVLAGAVVALSFGERFPSYAQGTRVYRIGILETVPAVQNRTNLDGLLRGLRERGYIEGQNLKIEYRSRTDTPSDFSISRPSSCICPSI